MSWSTLLDWEHIAKSRMEAEEEEIIVPRLLTDFKPNPGGQERFFKEYPLDDISDRESRWQSLIGGIGCIAGESLIDGIPIKDLTENPIEVETLVGRIIASPAYKKGQANLYRVITRTGKQILVTEAHRFLSPKGWHRLRDLGCGDAVACRDTLSETPHRGRSIDYQSSCQGCFRCDGVLLSPLAVFALDKIGRHPLPCGYVCNPFPHSIGSSCQEFWLQLDAFLSHVLPISCGSLRRQLQNLLLFLDRFLPAYTDSLSLALVGDNHSFFGRHPFQDSLCTPDKSLLRFSPLVQAPRQLHGSFEIACDALRQDCSQLYELLHSLLESVSHSDQVNERLCRGKTLVSFLALERFGNLSKVLSTILQTVPSWTPLSGGNTSNCIDYWDEIVAIEYVRYDDFYDLHVPIANHYLSQGIWHHNSGKSYCGAAWACSRALLAPDARGMITANSFGQLARSTVVTLVEVCRKFDIPLEPYSDTVEENALAIVNRQRCFIGPKRAFAYVLSMSSFSGGTQAGRGLGVRWAWLDETGYSPEQAFLTLDGRLGRGPGTLKGQGLITTSPNGFNWLYERFGNPNRTEERKRIYVMFVIPTRENVAHLGEDYVQGLESNYTEELARQELEGAFINPAVGLIYKYFNRMFHALAGQDAEVLEYDNRLNLHVTFDFNYSPAVAIMAQVRGNEIHVFKEFYQLDSDTWQLSQTVVDWIDDHKHEADVMLYGDASGAARRSVSRLSDWDIIFQTFQKAGYTPGKYGRLHKRFDAANPPVANRINSMNCLFKQNRLFVDLEGCPELVKDFEQLTWKGEGIDKTDKMRSHLSDALGYLVHKIAPFQAIAVRGAIATKPVAGIAG